MEIELNWIDKSTWGEGEWQSEPDKVQWVDEATNLHCLIVRNEFGCWCGYVGVTEDHPFYGLAFDQQIVFDSVSCELGNVLITEREITYTISGSEEETPYGICLIRDVTELPDRLWWIGFHCHSLHDYAPNVSGLPAFGVPAELRAKLSSFQHSIYRGRQTYCNVRHVRILVQALAIQLSALSQLCCRNESSDIPSFRVVLGEGLLPEMSFFQ